MSLLEFFSNECTSVQSSSQHIPLLISAYGGSWADEEFDMASISVPIEKNKNRPFHAEQPPSRFSSSFGGRHNFLDQGPPYIVKMLNIPLSGDNGFIEDLFRSRFSQFAKCKILVDPSQSLLETGVVKKVAFVELKSFADQTRILKWQDVVYGGLRRVIIEQADFEDFKYCIAFNQQNEAKLQAIEQNRLSGHHGFHNGHRGGPPNGAPPVRIYQGESGGSVLRDLPELGHKTGSGPAEQHTAPHPRSNPFGLAKPVDVVSRQHEIEKHLVNVNPTTTRLAIAENPPKKKDEPANQHRSTTTHSLQPANASKSGLIPASIPLSVYGSPHSMASILSAGSGNQSISNKTSRVLTPPVKKSTVLIKKPAVVKTSEDQVLAGATPSAESAGDQATDDLKVQEAKKSSSPNQDARPGSTTEEPRPNFKKNLKQMAENRAAKLANSKTSKTSKDSRSTRSSIKASEGDRERAPRRGSSNNRERRSNHASAPSKEHGEEKEKPEHIRKPRRQSTASSRNENTASSQTSASGDVETASERASKLRANLQQRVATAESRSQLRPEGGRKPDKPGSRKLRVLRSEGFASSENTSDNGGPGRSTEARSRNEKETSLSEGKIVKDVQHNDHAPKNHEKPRGQEKAADRKKTRRPSSTALEPRQVKLPGAVSDQRNPEENLHLTGKSGNRESHKLTKPRPEKPRPSRKPRGSEKPEPAKAESEKSGPEKSKPEKTQPSKSGNRKPGPKKPTLEKPGKEKRQAPEKDAKINGSEKDDVATTVAKVDQTMPKDSGRKKSHSKGSGADPGADESK